MGHIFYDFARYLSRPTLVVAENPKINLLNATSVMLMVVFSGLLIYAPLMNLIGIEELNHKVESFLESMSTIQIILVTVLIAPLIEEFLFRYPLRYPFLVLIFLVSSIYALMHSTWQMDIDFKSSIVFILIILVTSIFYQFKKFKMKWHAVVDRHFPIFFYWSVITFAYMHSYNFDLQADQWYLVPILVMPQFILALLLGYVRMRKHFGYAVYIHGINNLVPILIWTMVYNN